MEAPKRIWTRAHEVFDEDPGFPPSYGDVPQYIRDDLVEKLNGYAVHDHSCVLQGYHWPEENGCTCGLTELLKEIGE